MSDRNRRIAIALVVPLLLVLFAGWYDASVVRRLEDVTSTTFDPRRVIWALPFAYLIAAAGAMGIGYLAWWSRSTVVAGVYFVIGGVLLFALPLAFTVGTVNDVPGPAPQPILDVLYDIRRWGTGPADILGVIYAALALSGIIGIGLAVRRRSATNASAIAPGT